MGQAFARIRGKLAVASLGCRPVRRDLPDEDGQSVTGKS
jgi:hypothetical protein